MTLPIANPPSQAHLQGTQSPTRKNLTLQKSLPCVNASEDEQCFAGHRTPLDRPRRRANA